MATAMSGPRVLLRQLRETMAEPLASQDRLDKIVTLIATNMHTDVCSFYVLRDDGALELFATFGLKRESVHMTTLRLGEGLVGLIGAHAEPLTLEDAPSHPAFAYRPETGEDPFFAFLGVPVLRAGQTLGVLVVQNISEDGSVTDITFTVPDSEYDKSVRAIEAAKASGQIDYDRINGSKGGAKVSVVGVGMRNHAGVAASMFKALAEKGINIQLITTSEIKTSVLIDDEYAELAVRALHTYYGLDKPAA
jgi:hypothetical protein